MWGKLAGSLPPISPKILTFKGGYEKNLSPQELFTISVTPLLGKENDFLERNIHLDVGGLGWWWWPEGGEEDNQPTIACAPALAEWRAS